MRVREIQNRLRATIILFKLIDGGAGKQRREFHDVLERRASEGIDRLGIVSNDHHILMGRRQMPDDIRLQADSCPDTHPLGCIDTGMKSIRRIASSSITSRRKNTNRSS